MSQFFQVKLHDAGPNRLPVLALVRPLLGISPDKCRELVDGGDVVIQQNLGRRMAQDLVAKLIDLGAAAKIEVCKCGCSDGPDHFA